MFLNQLAKMFLEALKVKKKSNGFWFKYTINSSPIQLFFKTSLISIYRNKQLMNYKQFMCNKHLLTTVYQ